MTVAIRAKTGVSRAQDYLELTKPKVVALLVLTAWVGMMLAVPALPNLFTLLAATVGIGLLSAAAAAMVSGLVSSCGADGSQPMRSARML